MVVSTGWADWAGSVGFDWTWPLDPKTKACQGHPGAIRMILLHTWGVLQHHRFCPIWLIVGRCMLPDPTMAD